MIKNITKAHINIRLGSPLTPHRLPEVKETEVTENDC